MKAIKLPVFPDSRGNLTFAEFPGLLPFIPHRIFLVYGVPDNETRGEHAHKEQHQFLLCPTGSCTVQIDNGNEQIQVELNQPDIGLHIPPMMWASQYNFSPDAVLLVLASDIYDEDDYIQNHNEYLELLSKA